MAPYTAASFTPGGPSGYPAFAEGDPLPGSGSIGNAVAFLGSSSVRNTWVAVSVLWIIWGILFLARQTFGPTRVFNTPRNERGVSSNAPVVAEQGPYDVQNGSAPISGAGARGGVAQDQTAVGGVDSGTATATGHHDAAGRNKGFFTRAVDNVRDRIDRTYKLIRDLTLMLFFVVTLNSFGLGSGNTVLILSWIYVAFALLWAGLMMVIESRVIDLILGTIEMLLLFAILIIAFVVGWSVLD
ncbi:MAG: hypothetical protein JOS17DRAFT_766001 [Linnemannia elongata]|nr:MAG: hypothetical protein JOS17DRAFT_766001 [Linnemannia elongata]